MPKKAGISSDVKTQGSDKINFRDRNTNEIEIKGCIIVPKIIIDNATKKEKTVDSMEMNVIDLRDNKPKEFSTLSSRLQNLLADIDDFEGLIDNKMSITQVGSGFGTHYRIEMLNKDSKWNQAEAEARIKAKQEAEKKKKYAKK